MHAAPSSDHVTRFASLVSSQRPSGSLRKIVSVKPDRRTDSPSGGVMVISMKLRRYAQSPSTSSSRMSAEPSSFTPSMLRELAANVCLPNGSRPETMKITSSDIRLSTVSVSPARLAFIQASISSRIARSSGDMGPSSRGVPEGYASVGARFRLTEIDDVVDDVRQGRRAWQRQRLLLNQAEFQRADPVLRDEPLEIGLALREQCIGAPAGVVKHMRCGITGMLVRQGDERAIASLELVAAQL